MAEEEFQESEVIFSDNSNHYSTHDEDDDGCLDYRGFSKNGRVSARNSNNKSKKNTKKKKIASSLPVNIPRHCEDALFHCGEADDFEEEEDDEGEIVPPHVILGRRIAGKMAFSVCTGNGRTLKGRDLSQVRNSVLRMTGFLEA
ncbi:uncharacterized protein LOC110424276 [Herrania umbratica]|uniref:Uncharacterized protein LOC110424276 n=1 Tax=Herrania umbratica TaxID=108875 RepID=A0A6J1B5A4_9ROSI|nr:uncharacterized protein LOC110424276 [Herrania umbratica]